MRDLPLYNPHSNEKFMEEARNSNVLLDSLLDFFIFSVPLILGLEFIFYRLFFLLFDYEVSKYFRPYSFKLVLLELLIQNNLEYFSFLGCRAVDVMFSFSITSKCWNAFAIFFMFAVVFCTFCSYRLYYSYYVKLAKYFLSNMYRFKTSYILMTITFGVRPFLKGMIHALLY